MSKSLDTRSRNLLNFKPKITFIEPPQEPVSPNPISMPGPQANEVYEQLRRIQNLANAVDVLAAATQAKIDNKSKDIKIVLDPVVDGHVIAAMKRHYPNDDPNSITYNQYRKCRDDLMAYGDMVALKATVDPKDIAAARDELNAGTTKIGGFDTPEAKDGRLRPELEPKARIVDPINLSQFQIDLIRILVRYIWKHFLLPLLKPLPIIGSLMPDELPPLNANERKSINQIKSSGVEVPA